MSFSILQVVFIIFTSILFSKSNVVIARTPYSWFKETCNSDTVKLVVNPNLCLKILQSQEKIVSSANQIDLSVAIIESGISNGTSTLEYMENKLKKINLDPKLKSVLQECKLSYDSAIESMRSALGEVKYHDYSTSTYDLLIASTDNINKCKNVVASKKINDATILIGNKVLPMFGHIGYNVLNDLNDRMSPPPMNSHRHDGA